MSDLRRPIGKIETPVRTIRKFCLECMSGQYSEVEACKSERCWLFPYRMGKNPKRKKRQLTEQQKAKLRENLKKAREASRE